MNKADLVANFTGYLTTTGNPHITPAQLVEVFTNFVDSYPNLEDDADLLNIGEYNIDKTYPEGSLTLLDGLMYIATMETTGAFDDSVWLPFPLRACVIAVAKWDEAVASIGDIVRHHFKLYISTANFNIEEPGTGSNWDAIQVFEPKGLNDYVTDRYYQNKDIVIYNGSIYQKDGDGYSSGGFGSGFDLKQATTERMLLNFTFDSMYEVVPTTAEIIFADALPPGTIIRSIKSHLNSPFSGGGNSGAQLKIYHTSAVIENQLLSGNVFTGANEVMINTTHNTAPSNIVSSSLIIRVVLDSSYGEVDAGDISFIVDYTIGQI